SDNNNADIPDNFVLFEADDFQLLLPDDFIGFDLREDQDEAVEAFDDLGSAYNGIEAAAEDADDMTIFLAAREQEEGAFVDSIFILIGSSFGYRDIDEVLDDIEDILDDNDSDVVDHDVLETDDREVGFLLVETEAFADLVDVQAVYVHIYGNELYIMFYATAGELYDMREEEFEISGVSFIADE
ncbi:MAG: hypothetical protein AAFV98_19380, partial [Chloroflexota bacterium]